MIIDIIESHLNPSQEAFSCIVGKWESTLTEEEQQGLETLKALPTLNTSSLYRSLNSREELPFKPTSFKSHMRGYCPCQK